MEKVVFVILHYLTIEDTLECIESIKNNVDYSNYEIVIVDNASNNGTGEILKENFQKEDIIHVINNKENLGFAKGNNEGYIFAKEKLKAEFIILINNDTYILDKNFIVDIVKYYKSNKFHIMGPKIISTQDNRNQNPLKEVIKDRNEIIKHIIKYSMLYILNVIKVESLIKYIKSIHRKKSTFNDNKEGDELKESIMNNVPLHGACIICSPIFINNMSYVFYPNTFLFVEEDILDTICRYKRFITVYYPKITIFHKEDSSTDFLMQSDEKKRKFIYKNIIKSSIEFYKLKAKIKYEN